jgi:hypothetical protein
VYELKENMPITEYTNWNLYFARKAREEEQHRKLGGKKNLLDNPDNLVKGLTG